MSLEAGLEAGLAGLELGEGMGGRGRRQPMLQAMDDMLYGGSQGGEGAGAGEILVVMVVVVIRLVVTHMSGFLGKHVLRPTKSLNPDLQADSVLGFRSLPRSLARTVLTSDVQPRTNLGQKEQEVKEREKRKQRASAYFTRPRPGRRARPRATLSMALDSGTDRPLVALERPQPCLKALEAGRALSPPARVQRLPVPAGDGQGAPSVPPDLSGDH